MPTPATDALLILFAALEEAEQLEVAERIATIRAISAVSQESASAPFIRSLRRVAEFIGHEPMVDEYKDACALLREGGEDIKGFSTIVRHFGTWRWAKEAMDLSKLTSIRNVEARFRHRRVNKIWRFSEETLRETLARVVAYYGWPEPVHRSTCCESRWSGLGCRVVLGAAAVSRGVSPEGERSEIPRALGSPGGLLRRQARANLAGAFIASAECGRRSL
jgi:hypothetical protein